MPDPKELVLAQMQAMKEAFMSTLEEKITEIDNEKKYLAENGYSAERMAVFHRLIHTLVGSTAMFGFSSLSDVCLEADIYLKQFAKENKEFSDDEHLPETINKVDNIIKHYETIKISGNK